MMDEMNLVFEKAKEKAVSKIDGIGYTKAPWKDFSDLELKERLFEELSEFENADANANFEEMRNELIDIINFSVFLYLNLL